PEGVILDDLGRASLVVSLVALALAGAATAVASAASVLDQRATLARLRLAGTPVAVLQRARAWQASLPLVGVTTASVASGAGAGIFLLLAFGTAPEQVRPPDLLPMAGLVLAGLATGLLSAVATRPVLVAATSHPLRDR
ncbi:MAG: hypothetical protein H0W25_02855, partial [Acidimicrobiia bacterium]|nr:hypothetical protein [Acidimicrobiia bacterium]